MSVDHLLIIDPQNDFCDLPEILKPQGQNPTLPVGGAHADMLRLSDWIDRNRQHLDAVTVTMDHHHRLDIAHPSFWRNGDGSRLRPFTSITSAQVKEGEFRPAPGLSAERAISYLQALENSGRFTHMVWPVHCQIGTWGQCVHGTLQAALDRWEDETARTVFHVLKGENPWTEHYSALRAEIPVDADPATGLNHALLERLAKADRVLVGGEAGSHCVRATVEHLVENWHGDLSRIVLLTDAMSPVGGFEAAQEAFLEASKSKGLTISATDKIRLS
ncbi:MAG: cysteine hydrolase [Fibrobacterota bacterium]